MTLLDMVAALSRAIDRQPYYLPSPNQFQRASATASIESDWRITCRELASREAVQTAAVEATAETEATDWQLTNFRVCNC
ncbi:hypothetical protein [Microcoleus sp. bin38.metabat.b11b12b14.051]|uniref:hypothetical protein n=1 Tax=Microcoleus sp. bin38.metabat.b11b12b14.051 TaxID=2742709 RepID=UPI0025D3CE2A|nr:hypothetical protein [Microcoleus sp. bin38.metabat.b11b12b14.051]